jgi:hypothetical protein
MLTRRTGSIAVGVRQGSLIKLGSASIGRSWEAGILRGDTIIDGLGAEIEEREEMETSSRNRCGTGSRYRR